MIVGPIVAGKYIKFNVTLPMEILQPSGYNNNDTSTKVTGSCANGIKCPVWGGGAAADSTGEAPASTDDAARRFRRYMAY